jgi:hypothetical protein
MFGKALPVTAGSVSVLEQRQAISMAEIVRQVWTAAVLLLLHRKLAGKGVDPTWQTEVRRGNVSLAFEMGERH